MKVREAVHDDVTHVMSLMNRNASPEKSLDFMEWWNFGLFPAITFVAEDMGQIVGMFIVFKRKLVNGLNCGVLMGLVVDTDWRGTGLFKELGHEAMSYFADIDAFVCFTNGRGKKALENNFGFRTIESIETMISIDKVGWANHIGIGDSTRVSCDTKFGNSNPFPADVLAFRADEEFRHWRFGLRPGIPHYLARETNGGFCTVKTYYDEKSMTQYGDIVDFELADFGEVGLPDLIGFACSTFGRDVDAVTMQAVSGSSFYRMLKEMGFAESDMKHFFCIKVKDGRNERLYDPKHWVVKWGDFLR